MKKINILFLFLLLVSPVFMACDRDLETEGISRVTNFPLISLNGEQFVSIPVGGSFSDPGASATESGAPISFTTTGTVDVNTAGVYLITYTATNKDGFKVSTSRYVGVIAPDAAAMDITGKYKRDAGAMGVMDVKKLGIGHYTSDNIGGVAVGGPTTTVHFYHTKGTTLVVPEQTVTGGQVFSATNSVYVPGPPAAIKWVVINPGYGTAVRNFIKL